MEVIEMSAIQLASTDKHEGSLADRAYSVLRRDILDGVFDPGQPLRLEALKERYRLSFSPIREALTRLSADHLVVLSSLKGFRVAPVSLRLRVIVTGLASYVNVRPFYLFPYGAAAY